MDDEARLREEDRQALRKALQKSKEDRDIEEIQRLRADRPGSRIENYDIITALQQEIGDLKAQLAEKSPIMTDEQVKGVLQNQSIRMEQERTKLVRDLITMHNQAGSTQLTKREEFAKAALQGLLTSNQYSQLLQSAASKAVYAADCLIEELEK
jgi:hypothetical protein